MTHWKRLIKPSVYWRILVGFTLIFALMVLATFSTYLQLVQVRTQTGQALPASQFTVTLRQYAAAISQLDNDLQRYFVVGGVEVQDALTNDRASMQRALDAAPVNLEPRYITNLEQLKVTTSTLDKALASLLSMNASQTDALKMNTAILDVVTLIDTAKQSEQQLSAVILGDLGGLIVSQTDAVNGTLNILIVLTSITLIIGIGVSLIVSRSIVRQLSTVAFAANQIASGKLDVRVPVHSKDEPGQLAAAFNSMTEQLQETLQKLQESRSSLERSNQELKTAVAQAKEVSRLKSEFLSTMSHELRTPLNAIIGFTELMTAGASGPLNGKQNRQLGRIHENSLRLLSLIDDVLDLSRVEAGRVEIHNDPFSPREMIAKIASQTSSLAERKELRFQVNVDEAMPQTILGDQSQIEHVAFNLLSNAFKFTKMGEVELSVKPLPDGTHWTFSVRDTGIGIPAHAQEYIFEEFRQADGSSRRMYGGSGLGLAICRNLCHLMDGEIRVQSTLGQGSTFTVTLPLNVVQVESKPQIAAPIAALTGE